MGELTLNIIQGPTGEVAAPCDLEAQLGITLGEGETLTAEKRIVAARVLLNEYLGRAFFNTQYRLILDGFRDPFEPRTTVQPFIRIPVSPLVSVDQIQYYDDDRTLQTLATSVYDSDTDTEPGIVFLKKNQTWPTSLWPFRAVQIDFTAGYGTDQDAFPLSVYETLNQAVIKQVAFWHERPRPGVIRESAGNASIQYADSSVGERGLLPEVMADVHHLRIMDFV